MLSHNTQVLHEVIGASVTPFNRAVQDGGIIARIWNPAQTRGAEILDHMVNQQAQIIAYIDDYWMMIFTTLPSLLLLLLLRRPRRAGAPPAEAHAALD
jgi:DHA2 family multidrug resistance protein